ncbi:hypothetical protein N0V85_009155, partial [Neurospora sp. IMI 360204]
RSAVTPIGGGEVCPDEDHDPLDDELGEILYSDEDSTSRSELDDALSRVGNTIDCLLRLSAAIRNPAPHDFSMSKVAAELIEAFQPLDKDHIRHMFAQIDEPLVDRLAKAMAMRRQYLKYREEHASRIARGLEEVEQGLQCDASEYTTTQTVISPLPGHLKDNNAISSTLFTDFDDVRSQTSYAPTEANSSELRFLKHNQSAHTGELASSGVGHQANIHASSVKDKSKARGQCPLCLKVQLGTEKEYASHVGRHLENLALFVLPRVTRPNGRYADSYKNKGWQSYAAATAASVAKAVMERYVASARVSDSSQSLNAGPGGGQINQPAGGVTLTPAMAQIPSASFGPLNQGLQVVQSYAPINAEFHLPPGKITAARAEGHPADVLRATGNAAAA